MIAIYQNILEAKSKKLKLLAILLDPDKLDLDSIDALILKINQSPATHIFVGGSSFEGNHLDEIIIRLKEKINLPMLLFPGNPSMTFRRCSPAFGQLARGGASRVA